MYKDRDGTTWGINKMLLFAGAAGKGKVLIQGKNNAKKGQTSLPTGIAAGLAGSTSVTLQLTPSDPGGAIPCYSMTLDTVVKDTGELFKALKK